ncbi:MAG: type III-A CRISPR-associated protein Cas10/Csm1, partial [Rhodocyclaceae bacterium]|nr:type III-A CRISPR-associated protein Cas10/Csm1 [Rhodocyclaceae bacterium]
RMSQELLEPSSRVALAALLHDLGKFAERARLPCEKERLETWKQLDCPHWDGRPTHIHAAYTTVGFMAIEDLLPKREHLMGAPFAEPNETDADDSLINAAARHHNPGTFLQWIIATADRLASGFERSEFDNYNQAEEGTATGKNHYQARLLPLFESIALEGNRSDQTAHCLPLSPLSPQGIFPKFRADIEPSDNATAQAEYAALWQGFVAALEQIPASHRASLSLWLDHFDAAWLAFTHAIPSATAGKTRPDVSLYDHSKAVAALAVALWRWHEENAKVGAGDTAALKDRSDWGTEKFLLVQGDFSGIQDFIFAEGGQTQKHAHKLLRGRSFQVALLAECAALKLLDALQLPTTSQIINAAGKFLIVAPNTQSTHVAIAACRKTLNAWCLAHTYGEIGVGIATTAASGDDFIEGRFGTLIETLFGALDRAKHQRFDLCATDAPSVFADFLDRFDHAEGVCKINGRHPADATASARRGYALSRLADDQIRIGEALTKRARLLVTREANTLPVLGLDYFGYRLAFVGEEEITGKYGELAKNGILLRAWDFDAAAADGSVFCGYARRFVNAYVPCFDATDQQTADKYGRWEDEAEFDRQHPIKTLHHLACEDRRLNADRQWQGEIALITLKGDIDNLGALFQKGFEHPTRKNPDGTPKSTATFAKMAALSRQTNAFFALWLPWFCEHGTDSNGIKRYRNTYTVFAGGDDFFLIGPWESTLALAGALREKFAAYVANNEQISFSAGMVMTHPKTPVRQLARRAEDALAAAKHLPGKNAATLWGRSVPWGNWHTLMNQRRAALEALMARAESHGADFSTGLTYALLQLSDKSASPRPEDAIWHSQLHYRLARFFRDRVKGDEEKKAQRERLLQDAIAEIGGALQQYKGAYRLPLSVLLYRQRE